MAIDEEFRASGTGVIASYDYIDIAEGTGVINFNGAQLKTSDGASYALTTGSFYSNNVYTVGTTFGTAPNFLPTITANFDVSFNLPKEAKGTALINVPTSTDSVVANVTYKITATIQKLSGGVTTQLGTATSEDKITAAETEAKMFSFPIVLTRTHFKKGDILRAQVIYYGSYATGTPKARLGHDPKGRDGSTEEGTAYFASVPSTLNILIPFVINL